MGGGAAAVDGVQLVLHPVQLRVAVAGLLVADVVDEARVAVERDQVVALGLGEHAAGDAEVLRRGLGEHRVGARHRDVGDQRRHRPIAITGNTCR
jgi:hypothetical protein